MSSAILVPPVPTVLSPDLPHLEENLESIRRRNSKAEGTIRTFGRCVLVLGIIQFVAVGFAALFSFVFATKSDSMSLAEAFGTATGYAVLAVVPAAFAVVGDRLRRLKPTSRLVGNLVSILLCLIVFPFGLILGIVGLFTFCREPAKEILSRGYLQVIEQTPGIVSRGSRVIPVLYGILGIIAVAVGMVAQLGSA